MGQPAESPPHLRFLAKKLLDTLQGPNRFLLVEMPPGHGKSFLVSKVFPAWLILKNPHLRIMIAAHEDNYAAHLSGEAKKVAQAFGQKIFGRELAMARDNFWSIQGGSGYVASRGMKGGVMGLRPHVIVCDDLVKNDEAVRTQYRRDVMFDWWRTSCYTRLEPTGCMVQVTTRWHEDDVPGRTMEVLPGKFNRVKLRAISRGPKEDPLGRPEGEALWPERFGTDLLKEAKRVLDARGGNWYSALYDQDPSKTQGEMFKSDAFRYWVRDEYGQVLLYRAIDKDPIAFKESDCWRFNTMDLAIKTGQENDYTVLSEWIVTPEQDLLLDRVHRKQIAAPEQLDLLKRVHRERDVRVSLIESVQYQEALVQFAVREGLSVLGCSISRDKVARAQAPVARISVGKVFWRRDADWLSDWESELLKFKAGCEYDDQVDTLSLAVERVTNAHGKSGVVQTIQLSKKALARSQAGRKPWEMD